MIKITRSSIYDMDVLKLAELNGIRLDIESLKKRMYQKMLADGSGFHLKIFDV
jgi:hypothetical protein